MTMPHQRLPSGNPGHQRGQQRQGKGPATRHPAIGQRRPDHRCCHQRTAGHGEPLGSQCQPAARHRPQATLGKPGKRRIDSADQQHHKGRHHRHRVMRQLCRHKFNQQPERNHPGQQEAALDMLEKQRHLRCCARNQQAQRPQQDSSQKDIGADRCAMRLLSGLDLGDEIAAEGNVEKGAVSGQRDKNGPGKRHPGKNQKPPPGPQHAQPFGIAVPDRKGCHRGERQKRRHRTLDQDRCRHRQPYPQIGIIGEPPAMLPGLVDPHQSPLLHQAEQHQYRIRLGQMRLGKHQQRSAAGCCGKQRPWPLVERSPHAIGANNSKQHRQQAWQPVGSDVIGAEYRR